MNDITVYLAGKFENRVLINVFGQLLCNNLLYITLTNRWSTATELIPVKECARIDYEDIERSDILIAIAPFACGANSEIGYALGLGKKVIYVVDHLIANGDLTPAWGEANPLPSGVLDSFYNDDGIFDVEKMDWIDKGWIVHNIQDTIKVIEHYSKM